MSVGKAATLAQQSLMNMPTVVTSLMQNQQQQSNGAADAANGAADANESSAEESKNVEKIEKFEKQPHPHRQSRDKVGIFSNFLQNFNKNFEKNEKNKKMINHKTEFFHKNQFLTRRSEHWVISRVF